MMKRYLVICLILFTGSLGAKSGIDLNKFMQECQMMKQEDTCITMVWWMPYDYWKVTLEKENKDGQILDAKKEGSFTLTCYGREFSWRLPLGSLLPPKFDPETGESFPGNYHFNPFSGRELVTGK